MGALVAVAVGFLSGAWCAVLGARMPHAWMACVVVFGVGALLVWSVQGRANRPARRSWIVFAMLAAVAGQAVAPVTRARTVLPEGVARFDGEIVRTGFRRDAYAVVEVTSGSTLEGAALPSGSRIEVRGLNVAAGAHVRVLARVRNVVWFDNPSPHPSWPLVRPIDARARLSSGAIVARPAGWLSSAIHELRGRMRRGLVSSLSPQAAALSRALVLGEGGALDRARRDEVRRSGLSHVLAVSGLHVTLLAGGLVALLRRLILRIPPLAARIDATRLAHMFGIPFALSYAALVGDAPSAWRAAITASLAWGLTILGRRAHPVAIAAAAGLVLGASQPDQVARPGFILSIVATAAIVSLDFGDAEVSGVRRALTIALRTMVATAPITVWLFGALPIIGLLSNLIVLPLAALLVLPVIAVHALLATIHPSLGSFTAPATEVIVAAFHSTCAVFAEIPLGHELPPLDATQIAAVTAVCLALLIARRWRVRFAALLLGALVIFAAEHRLRQPPSAEVRLTFLDVGQGDATLIDLPDGRLMVVDAGGAIHGGPDPGERVLVPLLRARRRERIDVLVLTHPHPDHYGGMAALLDAFEVIEIWDTGQAEAETEDGAVAALLASARRDGVVVRPPSELCRGPRAYGGAIVRVLWPCPRFDSGWGPNENSLVIEIEHQGRRALLTGDMEAHAEAELGPSLRSVDLLKVAHHGSRTSSTEEMIARLQPEVAVVSAGRANRFGHPHAEVWQRLQRGARRALRTDRDGGVVVRMTADGRVVVGD